jgi:hypothetical protein
MRQLQQITRSSGTTLRTEGSVSQEPNQCPGLRNQSLRRRESVCPLAKLHLVANAISRRIAAKRRMGSSDGAGSDAWLWWEGVRLRLCGSRPAVALVSARALVDVVAVGGHYRKG